MERVTSKIFNLRTLIAGAMLWLILGGVLPKTLLNGIEHLNQVVFRIGLYFTELPSPKTPVTVIHVPDLEYERWLVDLPGAQRLQQLLVLIEQSSILKPKSARKATVLGVILERPIDLIQPESESLLADIHQGRVSTQHLYEEANEALGRRSDLVDRLSRTNVVLGVINQQSSQHGLMATQQGQLLPLHETLIDLVWPSPTLSVISVPTPVLDYFPIVESSRYRDEEFLAIKQENGFSPSFWTKFILQARLSNSSTEDDIADSGNSVVWQRDKGFVFGDYLLDASPVGSIIPIYGRLSGIQRSLRQMSLSAALSRNDLSGWMLIGRDGSSDLYRAAQTLAAIGDEALMVKPLWWSPLHKFLIFALSIFVIFATPLMTHKRIVGSLIFILTALVSMQIIAQALRHFWLPCGTLVLFYLCAFGVMSLWLLKMRYQEEFVSRADETAKELATVLLTRKANNTQDLSKIFRLLKSCRTSEALLIALYDLAEKFENLKAYSQALDVIKHLRKRKRKFKDIGVKAKELKAKISSQSELDNRARDQYLLPHDGMIHGTPNARLPESTSFGRYQIERELGRGASGTVYLGFDPLISRQVAIKTLNYHQFSESEIEVVKSRFEREAEAAGGLNHPNIVSVFDVGEEGGAAFIAMDFAKGNPLSDFVKSEQHLPAFEVYRIVLAVAEALEYAHNHKIVHRDIKPGNILYCGEPFQVKITDFGIARFVDHSHTQTGEILGSPLYMAPEQLLGKKVSFSADIFSLGVTFYQLLTGELPFNGDSLASLTYDIVHNKHKGARTLRHSLPASATRITNVALQKRPTDRYTSAEAMADALRKAIKRDFAANLKYLDSL